MISIIRNWLRQRALATVQVSDEQWHEAEYALPFLDRLDDDERMQLRRMAREFIATKEWSGAQGLRLTAPIQISIALQACLPILKLGLDWYRGWIGIVVYPGDFVIPRQMMDDAGVIHEYDDEVLGEAWEGGPVLVSWFDDMTDVGDAGTPPHARGTSSLPPEGEHAALGRPYGVNIVIHEFAHKLDMSNGEVDGMPALHAGMAATEWLAAFEPAYSNFCSRVAAGEDTEIDPYAAEHPAEFFAVASEVFFEAPELLFAEYPAIYAQLTRFYRQRPAG